MFLENWRKKNEQNGLLCATWKDEINCLGEEDNIYLFRPLDSKCNEKQILSWGL